MGFRGNSDYSSAPQYNVVHIASFVVLKPNCWYCVVRHHYKFNLGQLLFQLTESAGTWNSNVTTGNVSDLALCVTGPRIARMVLMNLTVVQVSKLYWDLQMIYHITVWFQHVLIKKLLHSIPRVELVIFALNPFPANVENRVSS